MSVFPDIKHAEERFGGGSQFYEFQKGDNRIRILAIAEEPVATHFFGGKQFARCTGVDTCPHHGVNAPKDEKTGKPKNPSVKYPAYLVTREKPEDIQLLDLPKSIVKQLTQLRNNEDWTFEGLPMPYDVTIQYDPEGGFDMYKVVPSPNKAPVSQDLIARLAKMKPLDQIVQDLQGKAAASPLGSLDAEDQSRGFVDLPVIDLDDEPEVKEADIPF